MSEIIQPDEPLYEGGEMSVTDWLYLECDVDERMPSWQSANVPKPFGVKINGEQYKFAYHNTRGWLFDGEYQWMSFIWHNGENGGEYFIPEELGMENFQALYSELIKRGFHIGNRRTPTNEAYNLHSQHIRGNENIDSIIGRIMLEGEVE